MLKQLLGPPQNNRPTSPTAKQTQDVPLTSVGGGGNVSTIGAKTLGKLLNTFISNHNPSIAPASNRPPSAQKKANTSLSTIQLLSMNVDKASVRDLLNLSNALKAEQEAKELKLAKLLEEYDIIQNISKADNAFETVNKAIEDEYGMDFKAEAGYQYQLTKKHIKEGEHPQKHRHHKDSPSDSTDSVAGDSITPVRENTLNQEKNVEEEEDYFNIRILPDSNKKARAQEINLQNQSSMAIDRKGSSKKLTKNILAGLDVVSIRSNSEVPYPQPKFTSIAEDLFAGKKVLQANTALEKALEALTSNDVLLKRKKILYEQIREANKRAAESQLYQLQLHYMRDQLVKQKVADNTTMNQDLLPQFEFQQRAHNQLLGRIADTNHKREGLQYDYIVRYKQQLLQKKIVMTKELKERFQKLIDEEVETKALKLKLLHAQASGNDSIENGGDGKTQRVNQIGQTAREKMVPITEDNYFKCQRLSEQMQAYKQFLMFLQQRHNLSHENLSQMKQDLYHICDRIAKARHHDEELDEYLHLIKIRKSGQERISKKRRYGGGQVDFEGGDRAGISSGGTDTKIERKRMQSSNALILKNLEKRGTVKNYLPTLGGMSGDTQLHSGDNGTPRRPTSLNVDSGKMKKLAAQLQLLFEQSNTTISIEESLSNEYNQVMGLNKTLVVDYDSKNSVNVARHMTLKILKKEFWELRYGNQANLPNGEDHSTNPSPKRDQDERNAKWEIMKVQSSIIKKEMHMANHRFRSGLLAHLHGMLFKLHIIKETVGPVHFPPHDRIDTITNYYKDLWPYSYPEFLKDDFNNKIQNIFKKKFTGEDNLNNKKASQDIVLDFNFGIVPTEPQPKPKTTTSFFANPNNLTSVALLNNTAMESSFLAPQNTTQNGPAKSPNRQSSNIGQGLLGPVPRMSTKFSSINLGRYTNNLNQNIPRTYSQLKLLSPEEIMKKNREIVVWDLLRQLREVTKYLNETINTMLETAAYAARNNALIPELSDDTSSNNTSQTPASRSKTSFYSKRGGPAAPGKPGFASKILQGGNNIKQSQSPHTSNNTSNNKLPVKGGNVRGSAESMISLGGVSGNHSSLTVDNVNNQQPSQSQLQPSHTHHYKKPVVPIIGKEVIKELRLQEDLADMNQKFFNEKYLKFLAYNEQNTLPIVNKAKNPEKDPQVLNKLWIECQLEEQFAKESYLHMKAYKEEQERLKAIEEARKAAALAQVKKMTKRERQLAATRLSLVEQAERVAEAASTEANIVKDRLNFTKLGNFEREEFRFRTNFKKQFNSALDMLSRNDFASLKETIRTNEEQFLKAQESVLADSKKHFTSTQKLQQVKQGPPARERKYVAIEVPKEKDRPSSEVQRNKSNKEEQKSEKPPRKSTYMEPTGKIKKTLQEKYEEQKEETKQAVQTDLLKQRKKDQQMIKRTRYPFLLPPPLNLTETCNQARAQTAKGGTVMVLNLSKLSSVPYTPHQGREELLSGSFSPMTALTTQEISNFNSTPHNIRSAATLHPLPNNNYTSKPKTAATHQSATTAATELANMIKSSFMQNSSALKTQDINSTRNQQMNAPPPHFLTSVNYQQTATSSLLSPNSGIFIQKNQDLGMNNGSKSGLRIQNNENQKVSHNLPLPTYKSHKQSSGGRISFGNI